MSLDYKLATALDVPPVDTVLVEPEAGRVELTVRWTFPRGRGRTMLREIRVDLDG